MLDGSSGAPSAGVVGSVGKQVGSSALAATGTLPDWCKDAVDARRTLRWDSE